MPLGEYQIKDNHTEAFHFTDPYNDIEPLKEFGINNFVITIKVTEAQTTVCMDAFASAGKCVLSVNLGDYIVKRDDARNPFMAMRQQAFEEKFEPIVAKAKKS